jgi:hypothetical protein
MPLHRLRIWRNPGRRSERDRIRLAPPSSSPRLESAAPGRHQDLANPRPPEPAA